MKLQGICKTVIKPLLLVALFIGVGAPSLEAQIASPALMQMAQAELAKRGLTESEVRTRLLREGIDVDNVQPSAYAGMQTKVMGILDAMQAEKKNATGVANPVVLNLGTPTNTVTSDPIQQQQTTPEEAAAEASQRVIQAAKANTANRIYGHSIFTDHSLDVFRTTDGAQAPETYVLGAGDEVHITIFGASQTDIQQRITTDGYIHPSGVARIFLKGLTLAQARTVIRQSLSSSYLFRPDQLTVTIVTARTVTINVFGNANVTGSFTLSALNSALNALSAAGGVTEFGSVRSIQLTRGDSKRTIDVYEFMTDPSSQFRFDLQNNDILFVPVAKKLVTVEGGVKRPMRYEMLDGETVNDLIRFAGGLTTNVYPEFLQIERYVGGTPKLFEWKLGDVLTGKVNVTMVDGDIVRIKNINTPLENYVDVDGSVYYPGRFDLNTNPTLQSVLANAKPNWQAKTDAVFVERIRPDSTFEFLTVPYPGTSGAATFNLQGRDKIHVLSRVDFRDMDTIQVLGQVRKPFTKLFGYTDRITVSQAIEYAGGLKESVYPIAYIFRKNLANPLETKYIRVNLNEQGDLPLQAGDKLNIYDKTTFTNAGELAISGAVKHPSRFVYDVTMSLQDLIQNAGGFNLGAAFNRVEVFRTVLSPTERPKMELLTLAVDSSYRLVMPKTFRLQPFDQVVVRMTPDFSLGRTVEINGQVRYPGVYVLESKDATLADVIRRAGGLLKDADPWGAQLFRTYKNRGNITIQVRKAVRHSSNKAYNPILFEGDVVNVNRMENTVRILSEGTRIGQYSIDTTDTEKNIVFQGHRSAGWYIRHFAGGFQRNADRHSVTVTYPNNQMQSTSHLFFFHDFPTVQPGSVISLRMDAEKVKKDLEPKEKLDFETTVSKTLSILTSTLSVILLVRSLK
jgi:protein involved in polysaccharide export with SLBB domain